MKTWMVILMLLMLVVCGCQVDFTGPSASAKVLYKGENGNNEYLSRGSGMTSGTGYGAGVMSWGMARKGEK